MEGFEMKASSVDVNEVPSTDLGGLEWPSGSDFCPNTAFLKSEPYPRRCAQVNEKPIPGPLPTPLRSMKSIKSKS